MSTCLTDSKYTFCGHLNLTCLNVRISFIHRLCHLQRVIVLFISMGTSTYFCRVVLMFRLMNQLYPLPVPFATWRRAMYVYGYIYVPYALSWPWDKIGECMWFRINVHILWTPFDILNLYISSTNHLCHLQHWFMLCTAESNSRLSWTWDKIALAHWWVHVLQSWNTVFAPLDLTCLNIRVHTHAANKPISLLITWDWCVPGCMLCQKT